MKLPIGSTLVAALLLFHPFAGYAAAPPALYTAVETITCGGQNGTSPGIVYVTLLQEGPANLYGRKLGTDAKQYTWFSVTSALGAYRKATCTMGQASNGTITASVTLTILKDGKAFVCDQFDFVFERNDTYGFVLREIIQRLDDGKTVINRVYPKPSNVADETVAPPQ